MNPDWKKFLLSENAVFATDTQIAFPSNADKTDKHIYPLGHLGVLTVTGKDAAKLLQGQITCNVNDITEAKSSLGALCTSKGRVITTFLLVKAADAFLLVLPAELLESVKKRLQMYILRSDVKLTDSSDTLCLIGLEHPEIAGVDLFVTTQGDTIAVNFSNRYLVIAAPDKAIALWSERVGKQGFQPQASEQWRYLDIISGIPWLTTETSEEFIPQMLNLDKLGGISFNKGCYTGQEIVARTHYLGKAKRAMFLAECDVQTAPQPNTQIITDGNESEQDSGKVLLAQNNNGHCKMLVVLQLADESCQLRLKDEQQTPITLLPLTL